MITYEDICRLWEQMEKESGESLRKVEGYIVKSTAGESIVSIVEDNELQRMGYYPYKVIAEGNGFVNVAFKKHVNFATIIEAYAYIKQVCVEHNLYLGKEL